MAVPLALFAQPRFPARCFCCGRPSSGAVFKVKARREYGAAGVAALMLFGLPAYYLLCKSDNSPVLHVPACNECHARQEGLRSTQRRAFWSMAAFLLIAVLTVVVDEEGPLTLVAVGAAFISLFAAMVACFREGRTAWIRVRAVVAEENLRVQFDDSADEREFAELNRLQPVEGAG